MFDSEISVCLHIYEILGGWGKLNGGLPAAHRMLSQNIFLKYRVSQPLRRGRFDTQQHVQQLFQDRRELLGLNKD